MKPGLLSVSLSLLVCAATLACGGHEQACRVGADCASGQCLPNGTCALDGDEPDASSGDGGDTDAATLCAPNHDGTIARSEMTLGPNLTAPFRVAASATVDTAGVAGEDGSRAWDFSGALAATPTSTWARADDRQVVRLELPQGQLRLPAVADAAAPGRLPGHRRGPPPARRGLARGRPLPHAAHLRDPDQDAPFPFAADDTWSTSSTVSGQAQGVFSAYSEDYTTTVDAHGTLVTPFGTFPVLRLRVDLVRTIGAFPTRVRTYLFASECYGTVGSIVSQNNPSNLEFTDAAEVRRLAP